MHPNIGPADRIFRAILALVLIAIVFVPVLPLFGSLALQANAIVTGLVLLMTALVRFCPVYRLLGLYV